MKRFDWSELKDAQLRAERDIGFEDILAALEAGKLLDDIPHPNQQRYPGQRILIVNIHEFAFLIPYVEDGDKIFLKTIYPSRKFTKAYVKRGKA